MVRIMPFQMTHLHIAKNIYEHLSERKINLPQFYLGSVAPDAVHNRVNYNSDYKKASHLRVGNDITNHPPTYDEWIENVQCFICKNKNNENYDFILGYCTHILSDIYYHIAVWTPFKLKYQDDFSKGNGGLYYQENEKVEIELALAFENKDDFWVYLEKSIGVTLENIIFANEVEKHKENILYHWFKDKEHPDMLSNKIITIESTMKFIKDATCYVLDKLISTAL